MRQVRRAGENKDISWSSVLSLASCYDAENIVLQENDNSRIDEPVVYAIQNTFQQTDPSTHSQYDAMVSRETFNQNGNVPRGEFVQANRESSTSQQDKRKCYFCGRTGHIKADCRRFKGLCLICGDPNHQIARCPSRQINENVKTFGQERSVRNKIFQRDPAPNREVNFNFGLQNSRRAEQAQPYVYQSRSSQEGNEYLFHGPEPARPGYDNTQRGTSYGNTEMNVAGSLNN